MGRVLKERRAEAFVSTKCGLLVGDQHIVANGRPGYVKRACDASLRRLQTDVIDLYQLHRADPEVPVEETWGAMAELVDGGQGAGAGAVRGGGAGARAGPGAAAARRNDPAAGAGAAGLPGERGAGGAVGVVAGGAGRRCCPGARRAGVGLLAAMPLGNGFLTGTLTPGQGFEPDDLRARHPRFTAEMMAANQPVVAGLRRIAERHGASVRRQVALAWVLAQGPHVVPVPGTKQERWAVENARAAEVELTSAGPGGDRGAAAGHGVRGTEAARPGRRWRENGPHRELLAGPRGRNR